MDLFTTMNILFDTRRGRQTGPVICRVGRRASHYMAGKNIIFNTRRGRHTGPVRYAVLAVEPHIIWPGRKIMKNK